jgi:hypothetical protein
MRSTPPHLSACALPPAFTTQDKTVLGIMGPTTSMDHTGSAHSIIGAVTIALEQPFEVTKEPFGSFPCTPEPEIEHDRPLRATVLPEVSLPVLSSAIVHLYAHRSFIRLDVVALQKFPSHCCYDRSQQFAHSHHPTVHCRPGELDPGFPLKYRTLAIDRYMVGIFADHRVNNDSIAGQAFINDPRRQGRTVDSPFFASFAGTLFTFGYPHKVSSRLDIELLRSFVANHRRAFAIVTADTLLGSAGNDLFFSGQLGWQLLPAGMFACRRRFQWQR